MVHGWVKGTSSPAVVLIRDTRRNFVKAVITNLKTVPHFNSLSFSRFVNKRSRQEMVITWLLDSLLNCRSWAPYFTELGQRIHGEFNRSTGPGSLISDIVIHYSGSPSGQPRSHVWQMSTSLWISVLTPPELRIFRRFCGDSCIYSHHSVVANPSI